MNGTFRHPKYTVSIIELIIASLAKPNRSIRVRVCGASLAKVGRFELVSRVLALGGGGDAQARLGICSMTLPRWRARRICTRTKFEPCFLRLLMAETGV